MIRGLVARATRMRVPLVTLTVEVHDPSGSAQTLHTPKEWDALRESQVGFAMPGSRSAWSLAAESNPEFVGRAVDIARIAQQIGAASVCSYGAGVGALEWCLHRAAPGIAITCTDFAPLSTERLASYFPEARVLVHDLARDEPIPADLALLHRVDTEFDDAAWRRILAGLDRVLMIPSDFLRWQRLLESRHKQGTRIAFLRTKRALRALWRETHTEEPVTVGGLDGFILSRRERISRQP